MRVFKYLHPSRIDVLANQAIRFTPPLDLNDPFEQLPYISKIMEPKVYETIINPSLAEAAENPSIIKQVIEDPENGIPQYLHDVLLQFFSSQDNLIEVLKGLDQDFLKPIFTLAEQIDLDLSKTMKDSFSERFGILSLTQSHDSLLMWAHYGDSHRGFVIEFDPESELFKNPNSKIKGIRNLRKVMYRKKRPEMSALGAMVVDHNKLNGFVSKVFLVKSSEWRYERELRQIAYFEDPNKDFLVNQHGISLSKFAPKSILNVYLGCNISPETKMEIMNILSEPCYHHVSLHQAFLNKIDYSLNFEQIVIDQFK